VRPCFLQDAHCEVHSDWLDAGYGDLSVPTVPTGFMREVVFHFEADTPSSAATRSHPARSVFYHFFKVNDASEGPSVKRMALLRAPANPDDADAEKTVQGTLTLTVEDFLRSKLNSKEDELQPSHFMFPDVASRKGPSRAAKLRPGSTPGTSTPSTTAAKPAAAKERAASTGKDTPKKWAAGCGRARCRDRGGCNPSCHEQARKQSTGTAAKKRAAPAGKGTKEAKKKKAAEQAAPSLSVTRAISCAGCKASRKGAASCGTKRAFAHCLQHPHGAKTGAAAAAEEEDATCVSLCGVSCYIIRLLQEPVLSLWSAATALTCVMGRWLQRWGRRGRSIRSCAQGAAPPWHVRRCVPINQGRIRVVSPAINRRAV
jgi:hypothetical protein